MPKDEKNIIDTYQDYLDKYFPSRSASEKYNAEVTKETAARMAKETLNSASKSFHHGQKL